MGKISVTEFHFLRNNNNSCTTMRPISLKILSEIEITSMHKCYISSAFIHLKQTNLDFTERYGISQNGIVFFLRMVMFNVLLDLLSLDKSIKTTSVTKVHIFPKNLRRNFGDTLLKSRFSTELKKFLKTYLRYQSFSIML